MSVKTVDGDLIKLALTGEFEVIAHGCNCMCHMGAGIAKTIKQVFPAAYEADCRTEKGSRQKLGTCSFAECETPVGIVTVVNCYTQYRWGTPHGKVAADYDAIRECMTWIRDQFHGKRIGLPKIGAGLAGGDWQTISQIIEAELGDEDVTVVEYRS